MNHSFKSLTTDRFNCIHINYDDQEHEADVIILEEQLKDAIQLWKITGVKAVWARVKREDARIIQAFTNLHFLFHHARPNYLLLYLWLLDNDVFNLPAYATHHLGAGGFVTDETEHPNQLLVVQERYGSSVWKLPGGLANEGENIEEACIREVLEETGIECTFKAILSFRQQHSFHFDCSDIYFACLLTPKFPSQPIRVQESEIKRCEWMDIDVFAALPSTGELSRSVLRAYKTYREKHFAIHLVENDDKRRPCYAVSTYAENGL